MSLYDFKGYLSRLDRGQSYDIVSLTGGLVNDTVRAIKTGTSPRLGGRFPQQKSLILKYAPPYIAKRGEQAPFSQFRQTIEARALSLFSSPDGPLNHLCTDWLITIPTVLHHDPDAHVLILNDLGDLQTLTEQLKHMTPIEDDISDQFRAYRLLGTRIGSFMRELHSPNTLAKLNLGLIKDFENPDLRDVILDNVVVPIRDRLNYFGIPDADMIYSRVEKDHLRLNNSREKSFVLGDLWTGSILLGWPTVCIIDWEFAGFGRGVNEDMATLFAQLHLYVLESPVNSMAETVTSILIKSIALAYRSGRVDGPDGTAGPKVLRINNDVTNIPFETLSTIRSTFITHGRKMINNAYERDWSCDCCKTDPKEKKDCKLIVNMVHVGLWYLRKAMDSTEDFAEAQNWATVVRNEPMVILPLFLE